MTTSGQDSYELKIRVLRSSKEIEAVRDVWLSLQNHPNTDIDHYAAAAGSLPNVFHPYVIAVEKEGNIVSLIAGRMEKYTLPLKIGYKTFCRIPFKAIAICHGGFLGDRAAPIAEAVIADLGKRLENKEAEMIFINSLDTSSEVYHRLKNSSRRFKRILAAESQAHWRIILPEKYENFIRNLEYKVRKNLRRAERKLSGNGPGKVRVAKFANREALDPFFEAAESIASKTYQRGLGVGFRDTPETRELALSHAQNGRFRGYLLFIGDKAIAFDMGVIYGRDFFWHYRGYDPAFRTYEPGTNLFLRVVEDLCSEGIVREIDFGLGDADYKRHFCNRSWQEESIYIFGPSLKGLAANMTMNSFAMIDRNVERVLRRLKIIQKIKRSWRDRAASKTKPAGETA